MAFRRHRPGPRHLGRQAAARARPGREVPRGPIAELGFQPDAVIECTGAGAVIVDAIRNVASGGVVCLTGVGSGGHFERPVGRRCGSRDIVLQNNVILGSVNANRRHFYRAAESLAAADRAWLSKLITRRVPPQDIASALERGPDDIKVVVDFEA